MRYKAAAGYLDNAVTVLTELVERMRPDALALCARKQAVPDAQRVGYLLERLGHQALADSMCKGIAEQRLRVVSLVPKRTRGRAKPHPPWLVVPNWKLQVDQ